MTSHRLRYAASRYAALILATFALLQGCAGGGGESEFADARLDGVAAVGAPIVGGRIEMSCATVDALTSDELTDANGAWSVTVALSALPCKVRVSGGTVNGIENRLSLHSLASAPGRVNVTPLTDLLVALGANESPSEWFQNSSAEQVRSVIELINGTSNRLTTALTEAGYTVPADFSPIAMLFDPRAGDPYDDLLEALRAGWEAAGSDYESLLTACATAGSAMPTLPAPHTSPGTGGDGAALHGLDGATGTLGGTTYTFAADAVWIALPTQSTGIFDAFGGTESGIDPLQRWIIRNLPRTVGTHACEGATGLNIQLQSGGGTHSTAPAGGSCSIDVLSVSTTAVTGRFTATMVNGLSGETGTVDDGYFRYAPDTGGGSALGAGEQGMSFEIGETTFKYTTPAELTFETYQGMSASGSSGFVQIHTVPSSIGTYACGTGDYYRPLNIWFFWDGKYHLAGSRQSSPPEGPAGSNCSVKVDKIMTGTWPSMTGTFEGSFSGTFVTEDLSSSVTVTNGRFRITK